MNAFKGYYSHTWYWQKNNVTGGIFAHHQPMRCVEEIHVFRKTEGRNNKGEYLKTREYLISEKENCGKTTKELQEIIGTQMTSHYFTKGEQFALPKKEVYEKLQTTGAFKMPYRQLRALYDSEKRAQKSEFRYYPQGLRKLEEPIKRKERKEDSIYGLKKYDSIQKYENYPKNLIYFSTETNRYHPTQKPTELLRYLIKTYTQEGETVLDSCMGSGSTGVACVQTKREFIGIEKDPKYYEIAKGRIEKERTSPGMEVNGVYYTQQEMDAYMD